MRNGSHSASRPRSGHPGHPNRQTRRRVRRLLFGLIGLLYVASVPWYRELDAPLRLVFGLPDWVAVALGCYVVAACLNAVAWLLSDVLEPAEPATPADPAESPGGGRHSGASGTLAAGPSTSGRDASAPDGAL